MKRFFVFLILFIYFSSVFGLENNKKKIIEKPFILEHLYHTHEINVVNTTVYQQIKNYRAFYNTTNIFLDYFFTPNDEIFINGSIAFGNGIVEHTQKLGYSIEPTGANLESYVENINDTGRKHLLEAWYHRRISSVNVALGIMDSASFVDENEYANDENTQFLNNAFTNNPIAPLPSFNPGLYVDFSSKKIEYKFLFIENEPDDGNVGLLQVNIKGKNYNIRPYVYNVFGMDEQNNGVGLSLDISPKENIGYFFRAGVPFHEQNSFFSIGAVKGNLSGNDKISFAFGFLNKEKNLYIAEIYYQFIPIKYVSLTFDIQYMNEYSEDFIIGSRLYLFY